MQEFQLNEQNFELEEKLAILQNELKEKEYSYNEINELLSKVRSDLALKEE